MRLVKTEQVNIWYCELSLHFEWTKVHQKCNKWSNFDKLFKSEPCGQILLPDRSLLIWQKMVENAKIKKIQMQVWVIFKQCEWYEKCRISKKCLEHQDGRLNIYSFSLYEPHDFLTNVYFLMTFYWNEEFTRRPFVKYVPYYYISFWFPAHNQNLPWSSHMNFCFQSEFAPKWWKTRVRLWRKLPTERTWCRFISTTL